MKKTTYFVGDNVSERRELSMLYDKCQLWLVTLLLEFMLRDGHILQTFVDLGCASGGPSLRACLERLKLMYDRGVPDTRRPQPDLIAIDQRKGAIAFVREKADELRLHVETHVGSILDSSILAPGSMQCGMVFFVLQYLAKTEWDLFFANVLLWLAPGGQGHLYIAEQRYNNRLNQQPTGQLGRRYQLAIQLVQGQHWDPEAGDAIPAFLERHGLKYEVVYRPYHGEVSSLSKGQKINLYIRKLWALTVALWKASHYWDAICFPLAAAWFLSRPGTRLETELTFYRVWRS